MQFRDLQKQYQILKKEIDASVMDVMSSAQFISGSKVVELEYTLAEYVGVKHCISCANGTDALSLALMTWGIGENDVVFVPDFTFFSSGECPAERGAKCIFVDVEKDTYNMDPVCLEEAIDKVVKEGKYIPRVVVAVDLFGQPANYDAISPICQKYDLLLLEDGAQGFGGSIRGKRACSFGDISTTSFFPAKPLGCYGDGGAIFTNNDEWADMIRSYAVHGKNVEDKYDNIRLGLNSRLDAIQAAILQVKFEAFRKYEIDDVNKVANWYYESLRGSQLILPTIRDGFLSSWAQYTVQLPDEANREKIQEYMKKDGVPTMIYYRKPMHRQGAFSGIWKSEIECQVADQLCKTVISLPIHPYMSKDDIERVVCSLIKII